MCYFSFTLESRRASTAGITDRPDACSPGLSALDPRLPEDVAARSSLSTVWRGFEKNLNEFIQAHLVAA